MNIDLEEKKIAKLEFWYNIMRISKQDEEKVRKAKRDYVRQLDMVLKYKRMRSYEKKTKDNIFLLEELF